jgi:AraC-like DNA-binding protein
MIRTPERVYDLHDRLQQRQALGNRHDRFASRALLLELLIHLLDSEEKPDVSGNRHSWLASRVRERLKTAVEDRGDIPPIQSMLSEFRYSYAHLCRLFHAEYGISPLKYVHALRIDRARLLLRDTTLSVSEIAAKIGFRDLSYFCQLFRKMTGYTPLHYRNIVAGQAVGEGPANFR